MTLSDVESCRVGQCAFQAVADLDEHLAVLDKRKKNHTVAPLLLADAPRLCHALCVISDIRVALHFRENRDYHLVGSFPLELSKLLVKAVSSFFRSHAGVVVEVRARGWRNYFRGKGLQCKDKAKPHHKAAQASGERTRPVCWF